MFTSKRELRYQLEEAERKTRRLENEVHSLKELISKQTMQIKDQEEEIARSKKNLETTLKALKKPQEQQGETQKSKTSYGKNCYMCGRWTSTGSCNCDIAENSCDDDIYSDY